MEEPKPLADTAAGAASSLATKDGCSGVTQDLKRRAWTP